MISLFPSPHLQQKGILSVVYSCFFIMNTFCPGFAKDEQLTHPPLGSIWNGGNWLQGGAEVLLATKCLDGGTENATV